MRVFRLATLEDLPALAELASFDRKRQVELPDIVFVAEIDGVIEAAVGVSVQDGYVVAGPAIASRKAYGNPFIALRLHEAMDAWLLKHGCRAYVYSVTNQNKRMRRWSERIGAKEYARERGRVWFARIIPTVEEQKQAA